jgi:hypothetical protein
MRIFCFLKNTAILKGLNMPGKAKLPTLLCLALSLTKLTLFLLS